MNTLRTPIALNGFCSKLLRQEQLMAMVPQGQEEEGLRELTLEELAGHHLILSKRHRKYVLSIFEKHGLSCDVYYECEDARTAMSLAASGLGTGFHERTVGKDLSDSDRRKGIDHRCAAGLEK